MGASSVLLGIAASGMQGPRQNAKQKPDQLNRRLTRTYDSFRLPYLIRPTNRRCACDKSSTTGQPRCTEFVHRRVFCVTGRCALCAADQQMRIAKRATGCSLTWEQPLIELVAGVGSNAPFHGACSASSPSGSPAMSAKVEKGHGMSPFPTSGVAVDLTQIITIDRNCGARADAFVSHHPQIDDRLNSTGTSPVSCNSLGTALILAATARIAGSLLHR